MRFITRAAAVLLAMLFMSVGAFAQGFSAESDAVVYAKTPYNKKYVSIDWNTSESNDVGIPLAFEEYLILPSINKVNKLSEKNGEVIASAELNEKVSRDYKGAIAENVLIQPARTSLYSVALDSMTVKASREYGEIATDVAIKDGCCYFGYKKGETYSFACADADSLDIVFEKDLDVKPTSPARLEGLVVFGAGEKLFAFDGESFTESDAGNVITNVFAGKYAVFMTCENGELRKARLDESGHIEDGHTDVCKLGGVLTRPAGIENHIYVGSTEGFYAVDGLNMEITEEYPELKGSSAPIVTVGNGVRAYTAAPHDDENGDRWYLYSILDNDKEPTIGEVAKIIDFTDGAVSVSKSGKMYFRDAKGQVWAISEKKASLVMIIVRVVIFIAMIIIFLLIIRALVKKRQKEKPPEY